jgi:O-succinylbenzoic acid--CoA ligase
VRNSVSFVPHLIAVDLPVGNPFVEVVDRIWQEGNTVLPLDQRLSVSARRTLAERFAANAIITASGIESFTPSGNGSGTTHGTSHSTVTPLATDDALVIATSGSTGEPKGVIHTHGSLRAHAERVGERLGLDSTTHWWLCLPVAHIGGFGIIHRARHFRSQLSFVTQVDEQSIRSARDSGATHTSVVPTLLSRYCFDDWRCVLVGGARSGHLPTNAISTYGLTETGGGVVYDGVPLRDIEISIRDGEVLVRTPTLARAYRFGALEQHDGWLRTGDLGSLRDGILHVDGRRDDLISTGGNKVWPHVVERRLSEHPLVADVAVRGMPDREWGSSVCAWVVPKEREHPPSLDALRAHVKETLAAYCAPRRVAIIDRIPRNSLGKIIVDRLPKIESGDSDGA